MTLDATVAGADANSYLTLEAAMDLAIAESERDPEVGAWLTAADADREAFLRRAAAEIDAELSQLEPFSAEQALLFPTVDDALDEEPYIPRSIERATFYQAVYLNKNVTVLTTARARRARDLQMSSEPNVATVERGGASAGGSAAERMPSVLSDRAMHYLKAYQRAIGTGTIRTVRLSPGWPIEDVA